MVLQFQILVCRYLGFIVYAEALDYKCALLRHLGWVACLTRGSYDDNDMTRVIDTTIPPVYMAEGSP